MFAIGQAIYLERLKKNMTQRELALKTGMPQPNLSNIEKGKQDITISTLLKIGRALGADPREFLVPEFRNALSVIPLSRLSVEKIARAVVHENQTLKPAQARVAVCLRVIIPRLKKRPARQKDVYNSWMELKNMLPGEQIEACIERVYDEMSRAA